MIRVAIPSQLRSYTDGRSEVEAAGDTVAAVLADLDRRFPGIRFRVVDEQDRIRQHMRVFVNQDRAHDLTPALRDGDEVMIFGALTGG
jgi:molybdopterin converting factor small subunit